MAKETHTGIDFFLRQPLREFVNWIVAYNDLVKEQRYQQDRKRFKK